MLTFLETSVASLKIQTDPVANTQALNLSNNSSAKTDRTGTTDLAMATATIMTTALVMVTATVAVVKPASKALSLTKEITK